MDDARSLGVFDVLAIDDDKAIEKFRLVDAIADTVGGEVAAKLISKIKRSGSFGYTAVLAESAAAQNLAVKITRVFVQPDPSKVRELADDVRDGKFVLPIGRRMPLRDAAEAPVLGHHLDCANFCAHPTDRWAHLRTASHMLGSPLSCFVSSGTLKIGRLFLVARLPWTRYVDFRLDSPKDGSIWKC